MRYVLTWLIAPLALSGCAGAAFSRPGSRASSAGVTGAAEARLTRAYDEQASRITELETRLALLEQEARQWREKLVSKHPEAIRIGEHRREPVAESEAHYGPVPVVRLHEAGPEPAEPVMLPPPPNGISTRLPVVPLPGARAGKLLGGDGEISEASTREAYRAALRLVREQRWDAALTALTRFLDEQKAGPLASSATYWRGEVHYALRRYDDAVHDFQLVLSRFPESDKTADSLLKLGMCHLRLGDEVMARRYFQQVREQYPSSEAARIASKEGSS